MSRVPYSYDEIPYESYSYSQSHPDRLATLASLFGMAPRPIGDCRVLELGCASGGNIIPMAYGLPTSRFVGIDLSAQQIATGQGLIKALGLTNIEIRQLDILDLPESLGTFEYIIAHGIYSWVQGKVQEKLLDACRRHLAPQGVAYVSYNTYPGWHFRGMIRDLMLYHTEQFAEASAQAAQARGLVGLSRSIGASGQRLWHHAAIRSGGVAPAAGCLSAA